MDDKKGHGIMDQGHMKEMMQQMMGGMLPPGIRPQDLPEPESLGATLLSTYTDTTSHLSGLGNQCRKVRRNVLSLTLAAKNILSFVYHHDGL